MPEGHTIHRIAADHNRHFSGEVLRVSSPQGRFSAGARKIDGRQLTHVDAYGKHLLYDWDGRTLHVHLGLYGKFRLHKKSPPPAPRGQVRMRVVGLPASFDLNGPTACELLGKADVQKLIDRIGPDPLRDDADVEKVWDRISRTRSPIGTVLLRQDIISGVGNVYRAEVLYLLRMSPERMANTLSRDEFDELWTLLVRLLKVGKRYNRIIVTEPADVGKPRSRMNRDERLLIYKKQHCPSCEAPVQSWSLGARTIYACRLCQS